MPDTDDTTPTSPDRQPVPANTCLDIDEYARELLEAWPVVGHDRDVVLCAALVTEVVTQLLRGDRDQAADAARRLHDVAEQAAEAEWPSWSCPTCGDTVNLDQAPEHERLHDR